MARFERDEAHRLNPLGGQPSFGTLCELTRVFENDFTLAAGIRHGAREVAAHSFRIQDTGDKEPASVRAKQRLLVPPLRRGRGRQAGGRESAHNVVSVRAPRLSSDVNRPSPLQQLDW